MTDFWWLQPPSDAFISNEKCHKAINAAQYQPEEYKMPHDTFAGVGRCERRRKRDISSEKQCQINESTRHHEQKLEYALHYCTTNIPEWRSGELFVVNIWTYQRHQPTASQLSRLCARCPRSRTRWMWEGPERRWLPTASGGRCSTADRGRSTVVGVEATESWLVASSWDGEAVRVAVEQLWPQWAAAASSAASVAAVAVVTAPAPPSSAETEGSSSATCPAAPADVWTWKQQPFRGCRWSADGRSAWDRLLFPPRTRRQQRTRSGLVMVCCVVKANWRPDRSPIYPYRREKRADRQWMWLRTVRPLPGIL